MTAREIQTLLTAQPFHAFALRTTRTGTYHVTSPGDVFLTTSTIYLADARDADGIATDARMIQLAQVTSVTLES